MCFGARFFISFIFISTLEALILQERSTGQYVVDTGKKQFSAGTALGLVSDVEKATEFTFEKVPDSPNGVFITKQGSKMVFDYARHGDSSSEVYLHPLHSQQNQQFMVIRDAEGYYQIVLLHDNRNYTRYDSNRKEFMSGPLVSGNGFRIMELKHKEPPMPISVHTHSHYKPKRHHSHRSPSSSSSEYQ